jgi:hypothetical protein
MKRFCFGAVIVQDPRKHGVLAQIVERPPRKSVERHQVLEIGHFTPLPFGRPFGHVLVPLPRGRRARVPIGCCPTSSSQR